LSSQFTWIVFTSPFLLPSDDSDHLVGSDGKRLAKAAHSSKISGKQACRSLSHKKTNGAKRSDFSTCVNGVAKLRHDLKAAS
jgi:hypothetical protein